MASGEDKDLTESEQQRMDEYEDDDMEGAGEGEGEPNEPSWLAAAAAHQAATAGLAKAAAVPSAVSAAAAPPKPSLQPSISTAMRGIHVATGGGAAPAAGTALPFGKDRTAAADKLAGKKEAESESESDSDTDEEEVDTRTDEQKQKDEIADAISAEIMRVESLGYKFKESTRWATVAAYLDAKELFDDEGLDLISCDVGEKKKISLGNVTKKIGELRAAAAEKQQAVVPLANGESQIDFFDDDEEEEKVVEEQDSEDWDDMSEAQLNAKISEMKKDLGLKTNEAKVGPVAQVLLDYKNMLKTDKSLSREEVAARKTKSNTIKTYFTEELRNKNFDEFQFQMMSELCAAEVTKQRLPHQIKLLEKKLANAADARLTKVHQRSIHNAAAAIDRREKRENEAALSAVSTPKRARTKK